MDINEIIKEHRVNKGLSEIEMADKLGIETYVYQRYENKEELIEAEMFLNIANILDIDVSMIQKQMKDVKGEENELENFGEDIQKYIEEIHQYKVLSETEENALIYRYTNGEEEAKKELAYSYLRVVYSVAVKYVNKGVDIFDLINEGNVGLLKALEEYKIERGYTFSTYATWWIKQYITRAISDYNRIGRIPQYYAISPMMKIKVAIKRLRAELGREPNHEELAKDLNVDVKWIEKVREYASSEIEENE